MDFLVKLFRWHFQLRKWRNGNGVKKHEQLPPEVVPPALDRIRNPDTQKIQLTWVGHATFLIQVAGLNILTDPLWSDRASPLRFAGPKRIVPPGIHIEDLPKIDAVLVSHSHYDHLDLPTLRKLGNDPRFFVPKNFGRWFASRGFKNVSERRWWESETFGACTIHAVPAKHWSRRSFPDHNGHGWCGWVLDTPRGRVYFVGDTAYDSTFKEIGERLGPMRVSLIPIGAYEPRELMKWAHINPEEAVQIHRDVRSEFSIGMHWGTFVLSAEPTLAPPLELDMAATRAGLPAGAFSVLRIGETRVL
jgi:L-ascorbate metabolism protein UlaG (beta-lactamase superfamily)